MGNTLGRPLQTPSPSSSPRTSPRSSPSTSPRSTQTSTQPTIQPPNVPLPQIAVQQPKPKPSDAKIKRGVVAVMLKDTHGIVGSPNDLDNKAVMAQESGRQVKLENHDKSHIVPFFPGVTPDMSNYGPIKKVVGHTGTVRARANSLTKAAAFQHNPTLNDGTIAPTPPIRVESCYSAIRPSPDHNSKSNMELIADKTGRPTLGATDPVTVTGGSTEYSTAPVPTINDWRANNTALSNATPSTFTNTPIHPPK